MVQKHVNHPPFYLFFSGGIITELQLNPLISSKYKPSHRCGVLTFFSVLESSPPISSQLPHVAFASAVPAMAQPVYLLLPSSLNNAATVCCMYPSDLGISYEPHTIGTSSTCCSVREIFVKWILRGSTAIWAQQIIPQWLAWRGTSAGLGTQKHQFSSNLWSPTSHKHNTNDQSSSALTFCRYKLDEQPSIISLDFQSFPIMNPP